MGFPGKLSTLLVDFHGFSAYALVYPWVSTNLYSFYKELPCSHCLVTSLHGKPRPRPGDINGYLRTSRPLCLVCSSNWDLMSFWFRTSTTTGGFRSIVSIACCSKADAREYNVIESLDGHHGLAAASGMALRARTSLRQQKRIGKWPSLAEWTLDPCKCT